MNDSVQSRQLDQIRQFQQHEKNPSQSQESGHMRDFNQAPVGRIFVDESHVSASQHIKQQFQNQQKQQNYLNQSFKRSEQAMQSQSEADEEEAEEALPQDGMNGFAIVERERVPVSGIAKPQNVGQSSHQSKMNSLVMALNTKLNKNISAFSLNRGGANPPDPRKNDTSYACLQIKRVDFFCTKENLVKHSNYLMRVFEKQEYAQDPKERDSQVKIRLPDSTKPDVLIMFLDHIDKGKDFPNKIDIYIAQNVLLISEALKMRAIQKKFLMNILLPMLNRENVIFFIKMSYNKLYPGKSDDDGGSTEDELESQTSHLEENEFWYDFLYYALDMAAKYIQYLFKKKSNELFSVLEPQIIEEIIEKAIQVYRADLQFDYTLFFETLMKLRRSESIFQLLDQERQKIIEREQRWLSEGDNVKPTLTWTVLNLTGNFYRPSDVFLVESIQWKLFVSHFRQEEDGLKVLMSMVTNPFEVKKSKDYYKKNEFFLASNVAGGLQNQANPMEEAIDEDLSQEEKMRKRREIEKANQEYPTHAFITIASAVRINSSENLEDPQLHTLICSAKTPALLKKFSNFNIDDDDVDIKIEMYFKIQHTYSAMLFYVSRNFTYLISDAYISLLPKDQFKLILKHKMLNVTQEDEVVKGICMWSEGQEVRANLDSDISELLENVNWNYVTLTCILDLIRNFPLIRRNPTFHKVLNREFAMRNKFNPETTKLDPPRFSYKYIKQHRINPNDITKNPKSLLYINHENFFQNLIDSLLEPADIIKTQILQEGVTESSHRKHLELQMIHKRRELAKIEEQLNNMRIMEEITRANASPDDSRVHNRTKGGRSSKIHKDSEMEGDDIETVKNSMINLLNVIVEVEEKPTDNNPGGSSHKNGGALNNNIVNLSHEVVQQLTRKFEEQSQNNGLGNNYEGMYEDLQNLRQNQKVQIFFKTQTEDQEASNRDKEEDSGAEQDGEEEGSEEEESENEAEMDSEAPGHEERKSGSTGQGLLNGKRTDDQIVIRNEAGASEGAVREMRSLHSHISKRSVACGGSLGIIQQSLRLARQDVSINLQASLISNPPLNLNHSREIQTSNQAMRMLPSMQYEVLPQQMIVVDRQDLLVDQGIQLTFEEPPEDEDGDFKHTSMHQNEVEDLQNKELERFLSHQASSISEVSEVHHAENSHQQSPFHEEAEEADAEASGNHNSYQEEEEPKESTQPIPFLSPVSQHHVQQQQVVAQLVEEGERLHFEDTLQAKKELDDPNPSLPGEQPEYEQIKIKYQKQLMQEYTSLVEKMSKDVFDANFLKFFQAPPSGNPLGLDVAAGGPSNSETYNQHYAALAPSGLQVQNPKVHNLNISIHNNANYAAPFPLDTLNNGTFTGVPQYQNTVPNHQSSIQSSNGNAYATQQQPQQVQQQAASFMGNILNQTVKLNGVKSPSNAYQTKTTPTGANQKTVLYSKANHHGGSQSSGNKGKPLSAGYQQMHFTADNDLQSRRPVSGNQQRPGIHKAQQKPSNAFKKPNLQLDSQEGGLRSSTPHNLPSQQDMLSAKHTNNYTTAQAKNQQSIFAANPQLKIKGGLNSPHLAQYVHQMPGSVKNQNGPGQGPQASKTYGYQNQQQAHQKVVKASAINKNQNKVILQQILNNEGGAAGGSMMGTFIKTGGGGTYQMTIDPSGEGVRLVQTTSQQTHHKTKSQPNQWSNYTGNGTTGDGCQNHTREKSNEQIQNEIMRMIVDDQSSFQQPHVIDPKAFHWSATPQNQNVALQQSFQNKRSSLPNNSVGNPATTYVANFNILDQLKQMTPHHQLQQPRYSLGTPSNNTVGGAAFSHKQVPQIVSGGQEIMKPQFGALAQSHHNNHHHQRHNSAGANIVLELSKLQMTAHGGKGYYANRQHAELCTIEESKRSEQMNESDSYSRQVSQIMEHGEEQMEGQPLPSRLEHQRPASSSNSSGKIINSSKQQNNQQRSWNNSRKASLPSNQ